MGDAEAFDLFDFLVRQGRVDNGSGSVDLFGYLFDLAADRFAVLVDVFERGGRFLFDRVDHQFRQLGTPFATGSKYVVHTETYTDLATMFCNQRDFLVRIGCISVEGHDHFLAETFHILDMLVQVLETVFQPFYILFFDLGCLYQVRQEGVFQQYRDRSGHSKVVYGERLVIVRIS